MRYLMTLLLAIVGTGFVIPALADDRPNAQPPVFGATFEGAPIINPETGKSYINPSSLEPAAGAALAGAAVAVPPAATADSELGAVDDIRPENVMTLSMLGLSPHNGVITFNVNVPGRGKWYRMADLKTPYTCANIRQVLAYYTSAYSGQDLLHYGEKLARHLVPDVSTDAVSQMARSFSAQSISVFGQAEAECVRAGLLD